MADYTDYPNLCIKVGEVAKEFPEIEELIPPERSKKIPQWAIDFASSLKENEAALKKNTYPLSVDIAAGMIMSTFSIYKTISEEVVLLNEYRRTLKKKAAEFSSNMKMINAKLADMERAQSGDGDGTTTIVNALATILAYSGVSGETATKSRCEQ